MHRQPRPPNQPDGSNAVTATDSSGGDPPPVGAAGASARSSRSKPATDRGERFVHPESTGGGGEPPSPSRCRPKVISPTDSLGVFQKRSIFHLPYRRSSSGYFSFEGDSLPSSPLSPRPATADKATQTPSPSGQVMNHALRRVAEAHGGGPGTHQQHGLFPSPSSTWQQNAARDMQAEAIGRELRIIGDDFNRLVMSRSRVVPRQVVIHPNQLLHNHPEPTVLLYVGILLLLIGRIIYLQGSTDGHQDHPQV